MIVEIAINTDGEILTSPAPVVLMYLENRSSKLVTLDRTLVVNVGVLCVCYQKFYSNLILHGDLGYRNVMYISSKTVEFRSGLVSSNH